MEQLTKEQARGEARRMAVALRAFEHVADVLDREAEAEVVLAELGKRRSALADDVAGLLSRKDELIADMAQRSADIAAALDEAGSAAAKRIGKAKDEADAAVAELEQSVAYAKAEAGAVESECAQRIAFAELEREQVEQGLADARATLDALKARI